MSDYEIAGTNDKRGPPVTNMELLKVAALSGQSVLSLVKQPTREIPDYGIFLLIVSEAGEQSIGAYANELMESLPIRRPMSETHKLNMSTSDSVNHIFMWLETTGECWASLRMEPPKFPVRVTAVIVTGENLCKVVARELTERGVPTRLQ